MWQVLTRILLITRLETSQVQYFNAAVQINAPASGAAFYTQDVIRCQKVTTEHHKVKNQRE